MTDTKTAILDAAQALIQTRGYTAMSFQDIAEIVGIKKPSIIHYFASKTELGSAVVQRYHLGIQEALVKVASDDSRSARDALELYFTPYLEFGAQGDMVCLCGALAGEFTVLPAEMQRDVREFFVAHEEWLTEILNRGKSLGEFSFEDDARRLARSYLSALQGALLIKRASGSGDQLHDVIEMIRGQVQS